LWGSSIGRGRGGVAGRGGRNKNPLKSSKTTHTTRSTGRGVGDGTKAATSSALLSATTSTASNNNNTPDGDDNNNSSSNSSGDGRGGTPSSSSNGTKKKNKQKGTNHIPRPYTMLDSKCYYNR